MTEITRISAGARASGIGMGVGLALVMALGLASGVSAAEIDASAVRAAIAKKFKVKVLKINAVVVDGKSAFKVTVMYPGGNFNTAFQVNTLIVDAATGKAVPVFRHIASGQILANGGDTKTNRQLVDALRKTPWR
jgi:ribosomal protein L23